MGKSPIKSINIGFLTCTLINFIVLPIILLTIFYKQFVKVYLKLKYMKDFRGLMNVYDFSGKYKDTLESPVVPFFIIQLDSSRCDENGVDNSLLDECKKKFELFFEAEKISKMLKYTMHEEMGYGFWKKNRNFNLDDHIKIATPKPGQHFEDFVGEVTTKSLPLDNEGTWEVLVCNKMTSSNRYSIHKCTFLLLRGHHCLGDGLFTLQIFCNFLFKLEAQKEPEKVIKVPLPTSPFHIAWMIWKWPSLLRKFSALLTHTNVVHPAKLSGKKNFVWYSDDTQLLQKVKFIKKAIPKTSFMDVVYTALSVGFYKYITKYKGKDQLPEYLFLAGVTQMPGTELTYNPKKLKLKNNFTMDQLYLNIVPPDIPVEEKISKIRKDLYDSVPGEGAASFYSTKLIMGAFPVGYIKKFESSRYTLTASNIPGFGKAKVCDRLIRNVIVAPNHSLNTGLSLGLYSYNGTLCVSMYSDQAIVENIEHAREFLNFIIDEIDDIYMEILKLNKV